MNNLIKWLKNNETKINNDIKIKQNDNNRFLYTNKKIKKNINIFEIPHKCIMTTEMAYNCNIVKLLNFFKYNFKSSNTPLALFLLEEKLNLNSFWKPYIDILPKTYNDFPQYYNKNELEQLKGSFIIEFIRSRNLELEDEYNEIINFLPDYENKNKITLDDFIWAKIVVTSRGFNLKIKEKKIVCLVPLADMLNHSKNFTTFWSFNSDKQSFILSSIDNINIGEVFDTYGYKCNSRYLINYGFTLSSCNMSYNNNYNCAVLFINPENILDTINCPIKKEKMKIISNHKNKNFSDTYCEYYLLVKKNKEKLLTTENYLRFKFTILQKHNNDTNNIYNIFSLFRFLLSNELKKTFLHVKAKNIVTEISILKYIADECNKALKNFNTTIDEDIEKIKNTKELTNNWNILNMLISEKQVLLYYIELYNFINNLYNKLKNNKNMKSKLKNKIKKNYKFYLYYNIIKNIRGV